MIDRIQVSSVGLLGSLAVTIFCGLAAGASAKIADETTWRWATDLGTYPSAWLFSVVVIATIADSAQRAAILAGAFSVASIAAYYVWSAVVLGFPLGLFPILWMAVAFTVAPAFASVVWLLRGASGLLATTGAAGVAGLILADGPLQQYWNELTIGLPPGFPFHPVQAIVNIVLAAATIGILVRNRNARLTAGALAVPAVVIAATLLDIVRSRVGI